MMADHEWGHKGEWRYADGEGEGRRPHEVLDLDESRSHARRQYCHRLIPKSAAPK
jgi:hypothetical protein